VFFGQTEKQTEGGQNFKQSRSQKEEISKEDSGRKYFIHQQTSEGTDRKRHTGEMKFQTEDKIFRCTNDHRGQEDYKII
jgi:hypothetical protein